MYLPNGGINMNGGGGINGGGIPGMGGLCPAPPGAPDPGGVGNTGGGGRFDEDDVVGVVVVLVWLDEAVKIKKSLSVCQFLI